MGLVSGCVCVCVFGMKRVYAKIIFQRWAIVSTVNWKTADNLRHFSSGNIQRITQKVWNQSDYCFTAQVNKIAVELKKHFANMNSERKNIETYVINETSAKGGLLIINSYSKSKSSSSSPKPESTDDLCPASLDWLLMFKNHSWSYKSHAFNRG